MTDTTNWQAEAERLRAERDEMGEQVAFVERHLGVISGVLGSPEPLQIDDIAARLHLLIAERDAALAELSRERDELADCVQSLRAKLIPRPAPAADVIEGEALE